MDSFSWTSMDHSSRILAVNPFVLNCVSESFNKALADSAIVRNAENEGVKRKRIECFRFLNSVLPFYIPLEQHNMAQIVGMDSGKIWGNAIHFLLCNKAHGFSMWKRFQEQVRSMDVRDTCRPHISAKMTNEILKHRLREEFDINDSSLQFITQEMVLIQLPFQPVLLFQWLISVAHLTAYFETGLYCFYHCRFPKEFEPQLKRLQRLLEQMYRNIGFLFDYLQHQVESEKEVFVGDLRMFNKVLRTLLQGIKAIFDVRTINLLRSITHKSLRGEYLVEDCCILTKTPIPFKSRNFVLNLDFWRTLPYKDLQLFGRSDEILVRNRRKQTNLKAPTHNEVNYVLQYILAPGDLKRSFVDKVMCFFTPEYLSLKEKIFEVNEKISAALSMQINGEERGIIGGYLFKLARFECLEGVIEVAGLISHITQFEGAPEIFVIKLLPAEYEDVDNDDDIDSIISACEQERNVLKHILRRLKMQQKNYNCDESTVKFYQAANRIVLNCIETQMDIKNFEKEKDEKLLDCQVVQYLVPCFAACSYEIRNHALKNWYSSFMYFLIRKFEKDGIRKSSWVNVEMEISKKPIIKDKSSLLQFITKVVEDFNKKVNYYNTPCRIWESLFEVLKNENDDDLANEPNIYWNWLMFDFFCKVKHAFNEANKRPYVSTYFK